MKKKNPRFADDYEFELARPDIDKIPCKDCIHRLPDRPITDDFSIKGATLGECKKYFEKPSDVLWKGAKCPNFGMYH